MDGHTRVAARARAGGPDLRLTRPVPGTAAGHGLRIGLLDGFGLGTAEGRVDDVSRGVQRLVAYVCLSGRPGRSAVAGQLWPDVPEEQAHASLRTAMWRLGRAAPALVDTSGGALALTPGVRVDVRELCAWAARVRDPRSGPGSLTPPPAALLGDLLPGWYEDWVLLERERLRQVRLHALETLAARLADAGRAAEAVDVAHLAVRTEPLRESAHRTLVRAHLAEGNVAEALRAYSGFRTMLRDELGIEPTDRFTRLVAGLCRERRAAS